MIVPDASERRRWRRTTTRRFHVPRPLHRRSSQSSPRSRARETRDPRDPRRRRDRGVRDAGNAKRRRSGRRRVTMLARRSRRATRGTPRARARLPSVSASTSPLRQTPRDLRVTTPQGAFASVKVLIRSTEDFRASWTEVVVFATPAQSARRADDASGGERGVRATHTRRAAASTSTRVCALRGRLPLRWCVDGNARGNAAADGARGDRCHVPGRGEPPGAPPDTSSRPSSAASVRTHGAGVRARATSFAARLAPPATPPRPRRRERSAVPMRTHAERARRRRPKDAVSRQQRVRRGPVRHRRRRFRTKSQKRFNARR